MTDSDLVELFGSRLRLYQPRTGYRFSIDALLLAGSAMPCVRGRIAELGAGNGIVSVLLARCPAAMRIDAFEIQPHLAALATRNCALNHCAERVRVRRHDIRHLPGDLPLGDCDLVVMNPPFYRLGSGRMNPETQNAAARHEVHGTLADFVQAAALLLKPGARLAMIYRTGRLVDLLCTLRTHGIEPKQLQTVHGRQDLPATMALVAGVSGAGIECRVLPPLILYDQHNRYTPQTRRLLATALSAPETADLFERKPAS